MKRLPRRQSFDRHQILRDLPGSPRNPSPGPANRVEAAIFAQNLANDSIQLLKFQQTGITYATRYNQPRTFGVNLIYRW